MQIRPVQRVRVREDHRSLVEGNPVLRQVCGSLVLGPIRTQLSIYIITSVVGAMANCRPRYAPDVSDVERCNRSQKSPQTENGPIDSPHAIPATGEYPRC